MLPSAAVEGLAGHAWVALSVAANASKVAAGFVGKKNVGAQIDVLRRTLEAPPEAGKRGKVHGCVEGDEYIGVLRYGLVGCQRADKGNPVDTG